MAEILPSTTAHVVEEGIHDEKLISKPLNGIDFVAASAILASRGKCGLHESHGHDVVEIDATMEECEPEYLKYIAGSVGGETVLRLPDDATELLSEFFRTQELRVTVYNHFESAFSSVLESKHFEDYAHICGLITSAFRYLSRHINKIEAKLLHTSSSMAAEDKDNLVGCAKLIRAVQVCEREKLKLITQLQVSRQRQEIFVAMREGTDYSDELDSLWLALADVVMDINANLEEIRYAKADLLGSE